jgi:phage gp36-like protein
MAYCTQADLEIAVGGAQVLKQLADPNRSGTTQLSIVVDYLEDGAGEIRAATEIKHDPETLANLDPVSLRRLQDSNTALSARIAYEKGGRGMAMPDYVRERAERADKFLDDLAKGLRRLGRVAGGTVAALSQPVGTVDHDPNGDGGEDANGAPTNKITVAGLMQGFR